MVTYSSRDHKLQTNLTNRLLTKPFCPHRKPPSSLWGRGGDASPPDPPPGEAVEQGDMERGGGELDGGDKGRRREEE